jgi:hypothetical protein
MSHARISFTVTMLAALPLFALAFTPARAQPPQWTRLYPSPRSAVMAYDSARGVTVLFRGTTNSGYSGETWDWNGTAWTQRPISGPSPRSMHSLAYDSATDPSLRLSYPVTVLPSADTPCTLE